MGRKFNYFLRRYLSFRVAEHRFRIILATLGINAIFLISSLKISCRFTNFECYANFQ